MTLELLPNQASLKKVSAFALYQVKVTSQGDFLGDDIEDESLNDRGMSQWQLRVRQLGAILVNLGLTSAAVVWVILFSNYTLLDKIDYVAYAVIMCMVFMLFIYLDAYSKFHNFHRFFECCFNNRGQAVFGLSLIVAAFVDYLLIEIYYRVLGDGGSTGLLIALYVLFYLALILMFFTFMAFWEVFAFYCAEYSYVHGFLYLSLIGGLVLFLARLIRPSNQGDWHHHHGTNIVLDGILNVITLLFVFLVVLAGIGIALFSEFGQSADKMGTPLAFSLLFVLSMIVMLTPLAPGNVVDVCGGCDCTNPDATGEAVFLGFLDDRNGFSLHHSLYRSVLAVVHRNAALCSGMGKCNSSSRNACCE
jgi:hypothetical protein